MNVFHSLIVLSAVLLSGVNSHSIHRQFNELFKNNLMLNNPLPFMKSDLFRSLLMGQTANEQLYNNLNAMINKTLVKLRVPRNPSNKEEEEEPHSKEATNEASDPVCGGGRFSLSGTVYMKEFLWLVVYDEVHGANMVYVIESPTSYENIDLTQAKRHWLKDLLNHDPGRKLQSMFAVYDYEEEGQDLVDINFVLVSHRSASVVSWKKKTVEHVKISDNKIVIMLNSFNTGYYMSRRGSKWLVRDVTFCNGWPKCALSSDSDDPTFELGLDKEKIYLTPKVSANNFDWEEFTGFITEDATVVLVQHDDVIFFTDFYQIARHLLESSYDFRITRVPFKEYFSCTGERKQYDFKGFDFHIQKSHAKSRTLTIYTLFGLHFVVALTMIALILAYSRPKTDAVKSLMERRSTRKSLKRISRLLASNASATGLSKSGDKSKSEITTSGSSKSSSSTTSQN